VVLLILAGCGQPRSEPVFKEKLELINALANEYESIGAKPPDANWKKRIDKIENDLAANQRALDAIPKSEWKDVELKYLKELMEAGQRNREAQRAFRKFLFNPKLPPK